jgi:ATP-dependent DNA helicase RecQ
LAELAEISGIGEKKIETYGAAVLAVVAGESVEAASVGASASALPAFAAAPGERAVAAAPAKAAPVRQSLPAASRPAGRKAVAPVAPASGDENEIPVYSDDDAPYDGPPEY